MPKRIQRRRTKGWKLPQGAIYVGRPTKWGNRFRVGDKHPVYGSKMDAEEAVQMYDLNLPRGTDFSELRGHDLACWCRLDQKCHADLLLRLANE